MKRRVVVTGMGAITPIGNSVDAFWDSVCAEKIGFAPITYFDTTDYKAKIAAEVKDFDPAQFMDKKAARRMEQFCQFAVAAAKEAIEDAALDMEKEEEIDIKKGRFQRLNFCFKLILFVSKRFFVVKISEKSILSLHGER